MTSAKDFSICYQYLPIGTTIVVRSDSLKKQQVS